jgi:hypothetical protein
VIHKQSTHSTISEPAAINDSERTTPLGSWTAPIELPRNTKKPANLFAPKFQRKRLRIKRLAGFFAFIRSNLCTRHIQKKLTPRGHHDWPDKRLLLRFCWA